MVIINIGTTYTERITSEKKQRRKPIPEEFMIRMKKRRKITGNGLILIWASIF